MREIIYEVLDDTDLTDPKEIAEEAYRRLTSGEYAQALREILKQYIYVIISRRRRRSGGSDSQRGANRGRKKMSNKRDFLLHQRWSTADGYKFFKDMNKEDLHFAANLRRDHAASNIAQAEWLEQWAAELQPGETIEDLPDETIEKLSKEG